MAFMHQGLIRSMHGRIGRAAPLTKSIGADSQKQSASQPRGH